MCYKEFCKAFLIISKGMSDEDFVETVTGVVNACRWVWGSGVEGVWRKDWAALFVSRS